MIMKRFAPTHLLSLCLLAILLVSCTTNPASKKQDLVLMSENQELELGQKAAAQVAAQMPLLPETDPLVQYVNKVGQRVAAVSDRPELFYRFHVIDLPTINAFALPGGYIYIYRGLLNHMNSEAELAAVLAHEVGHVTARHAVQRYTQAQLYQLGAIVTSILVPVPQGVGQMSDLLATAVIQGYGRQAELQSDELSIRYIAKAGYDVHATEHILETLQRLDELDSKIKQDATGKRPEKYHGAFASHPETKKRIEEVIKETEGTTPAGLGEVGHNAMLAALDGYPYGDSPEQGAMIGRRFVHPDMGIQLTFPKDWVVSNTPQALTAVKRQKKAYFQLKLKEMQKRQNGEELLRDMAGDRADISVIQTSKRDGYDVTQAEINLSLKKVGSARMLATVFMRAPKAFLVLGWSSRREFDQFQGDFKSIADSFHSYDAKRDGDIPRIALYTWKDGDNWKELADNSHNILGSFTTDKLAALNGEGPKQKPAVGTIIKIVK